MRRWPVAFLFLAAGCSYYNGMYNANRLARAAEKADREGRTLAAQTLWGQVAVKAESALVHHPRSKWADDALVLRGRALQHVGNCTAAVTPLERALAVTRQPGLQQEAALALGVCRERLGQPDAALAALQRAALGAEPRHRAEVALLYGRALRLAGRPADALDVLRDSPDPRAAGERAASLAALGRVPEAIALADSLLARADTAAPWEAIFDGIGRSDGYAASALVDRRLALPETTPEQRARWLLADGRRLGADSLPLALARLEQAAGAATARIDLGGAAQLAAARLELAAARNTADLAAPARRLGALAGGGSPQSPTARALLAIITGIVSADTLTAPASQGDLRVFLFAEAARDSLAAPAVARMLFARLATEWPASPYAPKALLAEAALSPPEAEALRDRVRLEYGTSPYLQLARGEDAPELHHLEDSLLAYARGLVAVPEDRPRGRAPTPAPPAGRRRPELEP